MQAVELYCPAGTACRLPLMTPWAPAVQLDAGGAVTVNVTAVGVEALLDSAAPQLLPRVAVYGTLVGVGPPPVTLS